MHTNVHTTTTHAEARKASTLNGSNGTPSARWLNAFSTSGNSRNTTAPTMENTMPATASPGVEDLVSRGTGGRSSSEPIVSTSMPRWEKKANSRVTIANAKRSAPIRDPMPSSTPPRRLPSAPVASDSAPATSMPPATQASTIFST